MQEDKVDHMPTNDNDNDNDNTKGATNIIETTTSWIKLIGVWLVMVNKESVKKTSNFCIKYVIKDNCNK